MKGGVDLRRHGGRRRGGAERERLARLADVEQLARDHAPLAPPLVGIDQRRRVGRRERQPAGRLAGAIGAPRVLDAREQQAGVLLQRRRNGGDRARPVSGPLAAAMRASASATSSGPASAAARNAAAALLGVEQPVGAIFVVGAGEQRGESLERLRFAPRIEVVVAPQRRDDRRRLVAAAGFEHGARQGELAGRRARRIGGEARGDDFGGRVVGVEAPLLDRANPVAARPMRVGGGESGEALVVGPRREPQRQPIEGGAFGRVRRLGGERVAAGEIALAIEGGGRGERRAVEARRRGGGFERRRGRGRGRRRRRAGVG